MLQFKNSMRLMVCIQSLACVPSYSFALTDWQAESRRRRITFSFTIKEMILSNSLSLIFPATRPLPMLILVISI
jgi:hypothetical protein